MFPPGVRSAEGVTSPPRPGTPRVLRLLPLADLRCWLSPGPPDVEEGMESKGLRSSVLTEEAGALGVVWQR